jgi:hypothetical protein
MDGGKKKRRRMGEEEKKMEDGKMGKGKKRSREMVSGR